MTDYPGKNLTGILVNLYNLYKNTALHLKLSVISLQCSPFLSIRYSDTHAGIQ